MTNMLRYRGDVTRPYSYDIYKLDVSYWRNKRVVGELTILCYDNQQKVMWAPAKSKRKVVGFAFMTCIQLGDREENVQELICRAEGSYFLQMFITNSSKPGTTH
ncbi:hypothetical protein KY285_010983 [Solanum tuberosum]|nr:hypothetical protein KY285_010983 [Solanum tuberosum]